MACQEEVRDDEPTEVGKGKPAPYYGQSDDAQWRKVEKSMHSGEKSYYGQSDDAPTFHC